MEQSLALLVVWSLVARVATAGSLTPAWAQQMLEELEEPARTLDVVEIFAGQGHLHQACAAVGLNAFGFDRRYGPDQDVRSKAGFLFAAALVLAVKVGGLLWLAPPCSSWVFLSSSGHKRNARNQYAGDQTRQDVLEANHIAVVTAALIRLAASRSLEVVVEQPADSCLYKFHPVRQALAAAAAGAVRTWLGAFAENFVCSKPLELRGNCLWLPALFRNKPCRGRASEEVYRVGLDGKVSGGRALSSTSEYPVEFGTAALALGTTTPWQVFGYGFGF